MSMVAELTLEELQTQHAELLPAREALALVNYANVYASNTAVALNAASVKSFAAAAAFQKIIIHQ